MLEELCRKASVRTEKQGNLSVDMASVKMGYRHRRGSHRSLAVDLSVVTRRNFRTVATEPNPACWKSAVAPPLGNSRFLQQTQRSAAGTDKNELGLNGPLLAARFVPDLQTPQIPITLQILHSIEKMNGKSISPTE